MWEREYTLDVAAPPETLWRLLGDVEGWVDWNAGIESITGWTPVRTRRP